MNKKILTTLSYLTILFFLTNALLAGCSSTTSTVSASNGLSTVSRMALGTLKLEGTSQAVTTAKAADLLTLWQGYESLSNSDTSSQVELDALVKQIESTMTSDQIKAIEAMDLTDQSVSETLSTLGGSDTISSTPASTPNASALSQAGSSGGSGGMPSGGSGAMPSGGPGGMPSGGDASGMSNILGGVTVQSTPSATQSPATPGTAQVNPMLLRALIQLLETRSQATG